MAEFKDDLSEGLKMGMRRLAASVSVISLKDEEGNKQAMTATSVTSLSDNPPALLVCINKTASAYSALMARKNFCVNVLNDQQADISGICSSKDNKEKRFEHADWQEMPCGMPFLKSAEVNFFCQADNVFEYGSHIIVVGKLLVVKTSDEPVSPLLYVDGKYSQVASDDEIVN